jgi:IS30 family transposase
MPYQQITLEERSRLADLRGLRLSIAAIARLLGRHRSTIPGAPTQSEPAGPV